MEKDLTKEIHLSLVENFALSKYLINWGYQQLPKLLNIPGKVDSRAA